MDAGCSDPLIRYLHLKWGKATDDLSVTEHAHRLSAISKDMDDRDYSTINKFYASLRAQQRLDEAFFATKDTNFWKQAKQQGWYPTIATVDKAILFPEAIEALGAPPIGVGLISGDWWSPTRPFKSYLTGETCQQQEVG